MKERYQQIGLCFTSNPILSADQSKEENTNSIKRAIDHMANNHLAILDGEIFYVTQLEAFVKKASSLYECNKEELLKYAQDQLSKMAPPINKL